MPVVFVEVFLFARQPKEYVAGATRDLNNAVLALHKYADTICTDSDSVPVHLDAECLCLLTFDGGRVVACITTKTSNFAKVLTTAAPIDIPQCSLRYPSADIILVETDGRL